MRAASSIKIFLVPMLYVTFQQLRERAKQRFGRAGNRKRVSQPAVIGLSVETTTPVRRC
jgi:hypothetical protein